MNNPKLCLYAHEKDELNPINCKYGVQCSYPNCNYFHGDTEPPLNRLNCYSEDIKIKKNKKFKKNGKKEKDIKNTKNVNMTKCKNNYNIPDKIDNSEYIDNIILNTNEIPKKDMLLNKLLNIVDEIKYNYTILYNKYQTLNKENIILKDEIKKMEKDKITVITVNIHIGGKLLTNNIWQKYYNYGNLLINGQLNEFRNEINGLKKEKSYISKIKSRSLRIYRLIEKIKLKNICDIPYTLRFIFHKSNDEFNMLLINF